MGYSPRGHEESDTTERLMLTQEVLNFTFLEQTKIVDMLKKKYLIEGHKFYLIPWQKVDSPQMGAVDQWYVRPTAMVQQTQV